MKPRIHVVMEISELLSFSSWRSPPKNPSKANFEAEYMETKGWPNFPGITNKILEVIYKPVSVTNCCPSLVKKTKFANMTCVGIH